MNGATGSTHLEPDTAHFNVYMPILKAWFVLHFFDLTFRYFFYSNPIVILIAVMNLVPFTRMPNIVGLLLQKQKTLTSLPKIESENMKFENRLLLVVFHWPLFY